MRSCVRSRQRSEAVRRGHEEIYINDAVLSLLSLAAVLPLTASGMRSWVSSPQLRSDCWSSLSLSLFPRQHPSSFSLCLSPTQKHTLPITSFTLSLLLCLSLTLCLFPPFFALLTDQVPSPLQVTCVRLCCSCRVTVSLCFPSVFTASPHDTDGGRF